MKTSNRQDAAQVLSVVELVAIAQKWAPRAGTHAGSGQPADSRWYCRLERNDVYEVWLMGWNQIQSTDFHNHGGSSGAVVIAAGALVEARVDPSNNRPAGRRLFKAGHSLAFGPEVVHNVGNADQGPSLSVHVYSPPLTTMTYFDVDGDNATERETVEVDAPETDGVDITANY